MAARKSLLNGIADNYTRPATPYSEGLETLVMKWSDEWLSNLDCNNDGKLDRGLDRKTGLSDGISKGWLTNHYEGDYEGDYGELHHYTYFCKIVWVGPAPSEGDPGAVIRRRRGCDLPVLAPASEPDALKMIEGGRCGGVAIGQFDRIDRHPSVIAALVQRMEQVGPVGAALADGRNYGQEFGCVYGNAGPTYFYKSEIGANKVYMTLDEITRKFISVVANDFVGQDGSGREPCEEEKEGERMKLYFGEVYLDDAWVRVVSRTREGAERALWADCKGGPERRKFKNLRELMDFYGGGIAQITLDEPFTEERTTLG